MTVAKVAGGTIAVGGTTGAAGYGTYRYLTYETLRDLIEKEKTEGENLVLLKDSDDETSWNKAADNYLVSLAETGDSLTNKLDDSIETIKGSDNDDALNKKRSAFKTWCLKFLYLEATDENKVHKDKVKTWCIVFNGETGELDLTADKSQWTPKYTALTTTTGNVKTLVEAKKNNTEGSDDDLKKAEAAKWWCKLLINKKVDSSNSSDFQSKCLLKTNAS